jgi:hypothetical protein
MAALQADSKCSHTTVYAALLTRLAPCPRTQSEVLKPLLGIFYIDTERNNSFVFGFSRVFLWRRLVTAVQLNISVMRNASFFPVIPHLFADKRIRIFARDVAPGADLVPSCQQFLHFHFDLPSAGSPACPPSFWRGVWNFLYSKTQLFLDSQFDFFNVFVGHETRLSSKKEIAMGKSKAILCKLDI